ncbi:trimeric intracellular cation channel family protein [Flavobacterium arcticum]|uniref:Trimeric intracellular cation channel family protein n=1 Tax=Flavobacterium arcticum TaxID=1784713 RepID=A0A345HED7_9FLAO|nr:trimeric intracellular cation channel family protein [Flavobacterium arcticum]AXG74947.1 trimeric intracellular cation channel family protein [Flavobacterium arcticum]KAF2506500.1 trimeric intracellular cation channel family protein [Flavobacterium arcticum]
MFYLLDLLGTLAFAISGVLTAMNKKMDPFGVFVIAFVTAVGGGTLRDVLIGRTPVGWMLDLNYVYTIIASFILAVIFRKKLEKLRKSLFLFDTIGLGVFTLIGLEKGLDTNLHPIICIALGTMTACFGGVIRDILCNDIPVIFRKEVYATICILGGTVFFALLELNLPINIVYLLTPAVIIIARLLAVYYKLSLPSLERK